jgi:hypothetical protein
MCYNELMHLTPVTLGIGFRMYSNTVSARINQKLKFRRNINNPNLV